MYEAIFSKIHREDLIDLFQELIQIPSEYHDVDFSKFNYTKISDFIINKFEEWGLETQVVGKSGFPHPIGRLKGTIGEPRILVTGHYNTVPVGDKKLWTHDPFGGEIIGDRLYGLGATDQKDGVVASMIAIKALIDSGVKLKGDLIAMIHAAEGAFEHSIDWLVENNPEAIKADLCLGTETKLVVKGTGLMWIEITTRGKSDHAPDVVPKIEIHNALSDLIKLLNAMEKTEDWMSWDQEPMLESNAKPVCTISVLESGEIVNTIPDRASARVDIRLMPSQSKEQVLLELNMLIEKIKVNVATLDIENINVYHYSPPGIKIAYDHPYLNIIQDVCEKVLGYRPKKVVGGSVLPAISKLMPITGCSFSPYLGKDHVESSRDHVIDEWHSIDSLMGETKFMAALFYELLC